MAISPPASDSSEDETRWLEAIIDSRGRAITTSARNVARMGRKSSGIPGAMIVACAVDLPRKGVIVSTLPLATRAASWQEVGVHRQAIPDLVWPQPPRPQETGAMEKTPKELDNEIAEYLAKTAPDAGRYMLVNNQTGKDMRIAHDFEVKQIQSKRHGIAMLELGGG